MPHPRLRGWGDTAYLAPAVGARVPQPTEPCREAKQREGGKTPAQMPGWWAPGSTAHPCPSRQNLLRVGSALLDTSNKRHWELIQQTEGGTAWLLKHFEDYASALAQNMPQTYLSPFTIVTPNIGERGHPPRDGDMCVPGEGVVLGSWVCLGDVSCGDMPVPKVMHVLWGHACAWGTCVPEDVGMGVPGDVCVPV